MKVLVTASARFALTPDGELWTSNASLGYNFWARYLDVYDEVYLIARAKLCPDQSTWQQQSWQKVSGQGIKPVPLPDFSTIAEFVQDSGKIYQTIHQVLQAVEAVHLRLPCTIGTAVWRSLAPHQPYGAEVVADPYDTFSPDAFHHPLRPFFRWWFPWQLRRQCTHASASLYVTQAALQRRYPCPQYSIGVANVELPDEAFVAQPRSIAPPESDASKLVAKPGWSAHEKNFCAGAPTLKNNNPRIHLFPSPSPSPSPALELSDRSINLVLVGTLAQLYKAPDILLQAVALCGAQGLDLQVTLVGEGQYRQALTQQASQLGLGDRVHFLGQLAQRQAVIEQLDRADLFVMPSRQEGLPRALVEAMARGLPCIGSTVGGIPELLAAEDLVPPGDAIALAEKIREVVTSPARLAQMSDRNLETARKYHHNLLHQHRIDFYRYIKQQTEAWLEQKTPSFPIEKLV